MKSARFLTSPSVHVILPPNWAAISVGPCQSDVWLNHASNHLGKRHRFALRLARDVAQAVHQRHVRPMQVPGRRLDCRVEACRLPVDQCLREEALGGVMLEPRFTKTAGVLRLDDTLAVGVQLDIVADATAERTRGILYDGEAHWITDSPGGPGSSLRFDLTSALTGRDHERSPQLPPGHSAANAERHVTH